MSIENKIRDLLQHISIDGQQQDLAQYIAKIKIESGEVGLVLDLQGLSVKNPADVEKIIFQRLSTIDGITKLSVALTGQHSQPRPQPTKQKVSIPGVKKVIAVASGKGGVGKSTTAVNLALALAELGYRVGLADADIYGPSIPKMLAISEEPESVEQKIIPIVKYGIKTMSFGFLVPENSAVIWRGPMAVKALHQVLYGTNWGELDYLIIDMPPGTGDIHLSLAENYKIDGMIIVSTPQIIALADVTRAINMYKKVSIPILGCVENMSYFLDTKTANKHYIFGKDGLKEMAITQDLALLAEIPMEIKIREYCDTGQSILADNNIATIYLNLARKVSDILDNQTSNHTS